MQLTSQTMKDLFQHFFDAEVAVLANILFPKANATIRFSSLTPTTFDRSRSVWGSSGVKMQRFSGARNGSAAITNI